MALLLGMDLGTTVLKVGLFEAESGVLRAMAARPVPLRKTKDGGREQSVASILEVLKALVAELREKTGAAWGGIEGVGIASQGGSSLILEGPDGPPKSPLYLWNDARMALHRKQLAQEKGAAYWRRHLRHEGAPHGLARIRWLHDLKPAYFKGAVFHAGIGDYIRYRLTGAWLQDPGHAIQTGAYNAAKGKLDKRLFALSGLGLDAVAPLRQGHETAPLSKAGARLLHLDPGVPVAGPYIDQEAAYMATASSAPSPLQCSLGTAWVGNFALPPGLRGYASSQLLIGHPLREGKLVILPLSTGNTAWNWALTQLETSDPYAQAQRLFQKTLLPPRGLTVFPWFAQAHPVDQASVGAGTICGLNPNSSGEDVLRATAAGLSFEFYRIFEQVRTAGCFETLVLCGGAARANCFRKLFAALFAPLPVYVLLDEDTAAARGALYAFSKKAASLKLRKIPAPSLKNSDRIHDYAHQYQQTHAALFPHSPGGDPYHLEGSNL